ALEGKRMKIEMPRDDGAILPEDREQRVVIEGSGTLVLSKGPTAITIASGVKNLTIQRLQVVCASFESRWRRFFIFAKAAWQFSK
ncbi:TPA: hypothetical protein ACPWS4_003272, partial [Pseudomonas aeruginosa]